jgi:catechol 2,3-dioxygenase-like lactoylglutathione lyase family enzyme
VAKTLRVVLNVSQFDEVVTFYRDLLGLPLVGDWERGPGDRGALLQAAEGGVMEIVGHEPSFITPRYADVALAIQLEDRQSVDALHERLLSAGASVSDPVERSWGHYSITLQDPVAVEVVLYADLLEK